MPSILTNKIFIFILSSSFQIIIFYYHLFVIYVYHFFFITYFTLGFFLLVKKYSHKRHLFVHPFSPVIYNPFPDSWLVSPQLQWTRATTKIRWVKKYICYKIKSWLNVHCRCTFNETTRKINNDNFKWLVYIFFSNYNYQGTATLWVLNIYIYCVFIFIYFISTKT